MFQKSTHQTDEKFTSMLLGVRSDSDKNFEMALLSKAVTYQTDKKLSVYSFS